MCVSSPGFKYDLRAVALVQPHDTRTLEIVTGLLGVVGHLEIMLQHRAARDGTEIFGQFVEHFVGPGGRGRLDGQKTHRQYNTVP